MGIEPQRFNPIILAKFIHIYLIIIMSYEDTLHENYIK